MGIGAQSAQTHGQLLRQTSLPPAPPKPTYTPKKNTHLHRLLSFSHSARLARHLILPSSAVRYSWLLGWVTTSLPSYAARASSHLQTKKGGGEGVVEGDVVMRGGGRQLALIRKSASSHL